ncbi:hypothetical protein DDE18_21280 [Nocardioides gansuensis]|uniref:Uncharacterized protein n=1 Tax=Nocardioides gansuensis TaxID=2138300 RepID=A0A2T8F506_9ACTN|nr:hypothetical protein [Nocardioides gansuensis]PVG80786.1 hypothetical protein DDE18_21280 [Nocardioides gansuensis]
MPTIRTGAATSSLHSGTIEYQGDAGLRGRETWSITCADDGTRTLQAHCRMFDSRVERWVVHTVDADLRPLRSFVSQRKGGTFLGEGWFVLEDGVLTGESRTPGEGTVRRTVRLDGPLDYFVPHAVSGDSWITPCYDRAASGWQEVRNGFTTSLLPDGSTGPAIEQHRGIRQRLVGEEEVTVPAGTYRTQHFVVSPRLDVEEHLWVTDDDAAMLVRLRSDRLTTTYVLTEHRVEALWPIC